MPRFKCTTAALANILGETKYFEVGTGKTYLNIKLSNKI